MSRKIPPVASRSKYKGVLLVGGLITAILASMYPIFVYPYLHSDEYKAAQKINRRGINREQVQPGNMRVWSDPFSPREDK